MTSTITDFCEDCWTGYIGDHECENPRPVGGVDSLYYYQRRREYLIRGKEDRWGDNDAADPKEQDRG
jgi:hypothetical protein